MNRATLPPADPARHVWRAAVAAILLAAAVPAWFFWTLPVLPFTDLPNHLTEAYVCGHPASPAAAAYPAAPAACQPGYLHAAFGSLFSRAETANAIWYTLYALLLPLGMPAFVRRLRGEPFLALLSVCWLFSMPAIWGFTGFTLAIPLVLLGLTAHAAFVETRRACWLVALVVLAVTIYYAHVLAFLFLAAVLALATPWLPRATWRVRLAALAALLPAGVLCAVWVARAGGWADNGSMREHLLAYYLHGYSASLATRAGQLLTDGNRFLVAGVAGMLLALVWSVPLMGGLLWAAWRMWNGDGRAQTRSGPQRPKRRDENSETCLAAVGADRFPVFSACSVSPRRPLCPEPSALHALVLTCACLLAALGCVLLLPADLPGQGCIYHRFGIFFWLAAVGIVAHAARATRHPWRLRTAILAAVILHALLWGGFFRAFDRQVGRPLADVLRRAELHGKSLAALIGDNAFRGQRHALAHLQNYQMIWNDGVAPTMATGYRFSLLHDAAGLPPHAEGLVDAVAVPELARRYAGMDFLLLHGADVTQAAPALAAQWTQVAESGGWMLLRRNAADGARR